MPFGEFQYSVDDKGRVIIPPSFREFVEDGMIVTRAAGRITLPASLRNYSGIGANVVIAGAPNRLEVWDEATWLASLNTIASQPPAPNLLSELVG